MDQDIIQAMARLNSHGCTCVLCRDGIFYESTQRGVKPLLDFLDSGKDYSGFSAADRVVGKATAYLYCLLKVRCVFAKIMSRPAAQVLEQHGIPARWETLVDAIENRQKTGPCPMEHATRNCTTAQQALLAVRQTLAQLQG